MTGVELAPVDAGATRPLDRIGVLLHAHRDVVVRHLAELDPRALRPRRGYRVPQPPPV